MRVHRSLRVAALLLPFAVILMLLAVVLREPGSASASAQRSTNEAVELGRIRSHFDSALTELSARDVAALTTAQRGRRAALLDSLRAYRDRGVFPHNYDFPGEAVPYFVDRKTGALCAVANLLASTGRRDVVERVARVDNNAWVADLAADTALTGWLDDNGLTLEEAARIQVPYMAPTTQAEKARNTAFIVAAPVALGGAAIASVWNASGNADGHRRAGNVIGLASGAMAMGMGAALMGKPDAPRAVGAASMALGGVSVALAARAMRRHGSALAAARDAERRRPLVETSLAPMVPLGARSGAGMAVSLSF